MNKNSCNIKVRPNLYFCSTSATKQNWKNYRFPNSLPLWRQMLKEALWCFESDILFLGKHSTNCCCILKRKYFYIVKIAHFNFWIIVNSKHLSRHNVFLRCDLFLTTHVCAHRENSLISSLNSKQVLPQSLMFANDFQKGLYYIKQTGVWRPGSFSKLLLLRADRLFMHQSDC